MFKVFDIGIYRMKLQNLGLDLSERIFKNSCSAQRTELTQKCKMRTYFAGISGVVGGLHSLSIKS